MKRLKNGLTVTIQEVAEEAGVSTATVSRVINKNSVVSRITELQVKKAIQKLGYKPNRSARNLRAGKVNRVGVLFADIQNPFFTSVLAGIESSLQKADYVLLLGNANENPKTEEIHLQVFQEEGVAGIILASVSNSSDEYKKIIQAGIPIVALDRSIEDFNIDSISINNVEAAEIATNHLLNLGHNNIAFIGGPEKISTARLRKEGYQRALQSKGFKNGKIELGNFRQDGGYHSMKRILAEDRVPSAVLVSNNLMTLGALQAIHENGLKIPKDIALVGFDDMPWATSLQPPLTVIAQPTYDMGSIAVRLLLDRIENPNNPVQQVILHSFLIVRESCGGKKI